MSNISAEVIAKRFRTTLGKLIGASTKLNEFSQINPDVKTGAKYEKLVTDLNSLKLEILSLSPSARKKYKSPNDFPTYGPDIQEAMISCLITDASDGTTSTHNIDSESIKNLIEPVTIKVPKFDAKGQPVVIVTDGVNGEDQYIQESEEQTIFALKGKNIEEVVNNFAKIISDIQNNTSSEVQSLRDNIEDLESKIEDTKGEFEELIEEKISNSLPEAPSLNIEEEIDKYLTSPRGVTRQNNFLSNKFYIAKFKKFFKELKDLHLARTQTGALMSKSNLGNALLSDISYTGHNTEGKLVTLRGKAIDVLNDYTWDKLSQDFVKFNNENPVSLLENVLGDDEEANRIFTNMIYSSFKISTNKLLGDNPTLPSNTFEGQLPENPYEVNRNDFFTNTTNSNLIHNTVMGSNQPIYGLDRFLNQNQSQQQYPTQIQQPINQNQIPYNNYAENNYNGEMPVYVNVPMENINQHVDEAMGNLPLPAPQIQQAQKRDLSGLDLSL
jgi:hypothetical protein